ncbi:MAG: endonuclease/exonuclease/phosphatase family protein [Planctomycetota bacterium]
MLCAASWVFAVPSAVVAACVVCVGLIDPAEPHWLGWSVDTASNLAAQALCAGAVAVIAAGLSRSWAACAAALGAVLLLAVQLLGSPRLESNAGATGVPVRVVVFNAFSGTTRPRAQLEAIIGSGADVLAIIEPSAELVRLIESDPALLEVYPYSSVPSGWVFAGPLIVSRHPVRVDADGFGMVWREVVSAATAEAGEGSGLERQAVRLSRIDHPAGPFVFVACQFRSPRGPGRWAAGNGQARSLGAALRVVRSRMAVPMIVGGDFNAVPLSSRSRQLSDRAGLARAKPVLAAAGTFPAWLPWPATLSIDGALASGGVRVRSWRVVPWPGSDHHAIETELLLPAHVPPAMDR